MLHPSEELRDYCKGNSKVLPPLENITEEKAFNAGSSASRESTIYNCHYSFFATPILDESWLNGWLAGFLLGSRVYIQIDSVSGVLGTIIDVEYPDQYIVICDDGFKWKGDSDKAEFIE